MKIRNFAILSGNFTEAGNFSGYDVFGNRLHIHARQMTTLGWVKNEDVKFPFFAVGDVKQIGQLDENGDAKLNSDGSAVLIDRLTASSVFTSKQQLIEAHVDVATIDIDINAAIIAKATTAGLKETDLAALLAASV